MSLENHFKSCGRKKITTPEIDEAIFEYVNDQKFVSATEIGDIIGVSRRTVGRRLKERGLFCRKPAIKTEMTPECRAARVAFIEQNYNIDWNMVVFSDEKTFRSYSDRKKVLYRPVNHRYHPEYIQHQKRSGRITCGVWGFITAGGFGELSEISSKMNSTEYISLLDEIYVPSMQALYGDESHNFLLMQDNASIHCSAETLRYINSRPEITVLQKWPPYSPDMNPIENVWAKMVYDWEVDATMSRQAIVNEAKLRWERCIGDSDYISNLYGSIPKRFDEILEKDGYACKY